MEVGVALGGRACLLKDIPWYDGAPTRNFWERGLDQMAHKGVHHTQKSRTEECVDGFLARFPSQHF